MVELEDLPQNTSLLRNISPMDSVWLAQLINAKLAKDRQSFYDSMERELDVSLQLTSTQRLDLLTSTVDSSFARLAIRAISVS